MILQNEIKQKTEEWKVPPETVDKDYVLGHFLSVLMENFPKQLVFKGGTCLRKCYFESYRFSEDLDFTAINHSFVLEQKQLNKIAKTAENKTGIKFVAEKIKLLISKDVPKGFQVNIKYWGANHSKNQRPLPPARWHTKIKLEISTEELLVLPTEKRAIIHPYSDELVGETHCSCYSINEVIAEKLRALKQRSYTAPRDFYDIYHLTKNFSKEDWDNVIPVFLKKMKHKRLVYQNPEDLIDESKTGNVKRAWKSSIAHQVKNDNKVKSDEIIQEVVQNIKTYLPNGE